MMVKLLNDDDGDDDDDDAADDDTDADAGCTCTGEFAFSVLCTPRICLPIHLCFYL